MGELARRPGCPELPKTPLELLTPRPGEGFTAAQYYSWPMVGLVTGLLGSISNNLFQRRPLWSGLPLHIMYAAVGYFSLSWLRDVKFASKADDDAVLRHYITLHPEDFPPFERKRWKEIYKPFEPYR